MREDYKKGGKSKRRQQIIRVLLLRRETCGGADRHAVDELAKICKRVAKAVGDG